jgi:Protein of unknown function (DUF983)
MRERCEHCNQKFEIEPGFFYGAMFTSYILSAFIILGSFAIYFFLFGLHILIAGGLMLLTALITYVYQYRIGRSTWAHAFIFFDPSKK